MMNAYEHLSPTVAASGRTFAKITDTVSKLAVENKEMVFVCDDPFYTPDLSTIGCKLKMFCTAWRWAESRKSDLSHPTDRPSDDCDCISIKNSCDISNVSEE